MTTTMTRQEILNRMRQIEEESSRLTQENLRKVTSQHDVDLIYALHKEWNELHEALLEMES